MNPSTREFDTKGKDMFTTLKFLVLFLCVIPILQRNFAFISSSELVYFNIVKMILFFIVITLTAVFWFIINYALKAEKVRIAFEVTVMYAVCLMCYMGTGMEDSKYKFIFALVILLYSMDFGLRFGMIFSILSGLSVIVIDLCSCDPNRRSMYFQPDLMLLGSFCLLAYIVGYYVEKDRKRISALSDAVNRDSLTGLYNHRYFYDYMHDRMAKPPVGKSQFIMIMDIDYFKSYNDIQGHQCGDTALKTIADLCKLHFGGDHCFRYGGEEFVIYLEALDCDQAYNMANELRATIEQHEFEGQEMQPGHNLTVSIGISVRREVEDTLADWIGRADNALYKAKAFRKNRVQLYSSVYDRFDHLDQIDEEERIISIRALLSVINSRDRYTYNHTDRVVHYCEAYSKHAGLSEEDSRLLLYGAYLHDIGKINVPQEILISEKRLTDQEWMQMKRHPSDGAEIAQKIRNFDIVADIVRQHHEKFNGTGYPNGAKGEEIHVLARVLTLADSFDAMTAKRPYQKVMTFEEAFEEIRRCKGSHFDPELAEIFISAVSSSYM